MLASGGGGGRVVQGCISVRESAARVPRPGDGWPSGSPRAERPALTQNRRRGKPGRPEGPSRRVCEGGGWSRPARRPRLSSPKPPAIN